MQRGLSLGLACQMYGVGNSLITRWARGAVGRRSAYLVYPKPHIYSSTVRGLASLNIYEVCQGQDVHFNIPGDVD